MTGQLSRSLQVRKYAVKSKAGIVCAQSRVAAEIGADTLRAGGNAVDAAVAASFALGSAEPWMSGVGGGGYMILRHKDQSGAQVVDFGMKTPNDLDPADYPLTDDLSGDLFGWPQVVDDANIKGAKAVAIPGMVAGMGLAHREFGSLPWESLVRPAAELARDGLPVDWYCQLVLSGAAAGLADCPTMRKAFLDAKGFPKSAAWTALDDVRCDLSSLAQTLDRIAKEGPESFYEGPLAASIQRDLSAAGGRHSSSDLSDYRAKLVAAGRFRYRGHEVFITPELTAGPTLRRMFELLEEGWSPSTARPNGDTYVAYDTAIRAAFEERVLTMGDHVSEPAPSCTTHFNVIDRHGVMVAVTQTLLSLFGAQLMLPESGVIMNNGVMWFDPEPGKPNSIGPAKRCLANMCPTLLRRADGAAFALGAAGGRKIMSAVAQLSSFLLDYEMELEEAIHSPRLDMSKPEATIVDERLERTVHNAAREKTPVLVSAPYTVYPYAFGIPSAAALIDGTTSAVTEVMSPWADSVAE